jgi:hypothetical protein
MQLNAATIAFAASLYLQDSADTGTIAVTTNLAATNDTEAAVAATATINPTGSNNSILYTAATAGEAGNAITVEYVISGVGSTATVTVSGTAITVTAGSACVASAVITAVNALPSAAALVTAAASGTVTGVIAAIAATALTGGLDATGWTGATLDFQGDALGDPTAAYGLIVYCESGSVVVTKGTDIKIPIAAGGKALIGNAAGIAELLGSLVFTAAANDTRVYIAIMAS